MPQLVEIRLNDDRIVLKDNLVKTAILPTVSKELERDVVIQGDCVIEGAVYARTLEIQQGPLRVKGAVFTQLELHVNTDSRGSVVFEKAVASAKAVISLGPGSRLHFLADISARRVHLRNAYVAANIFADEIILEDCVVVGGVFATRSLELHDCVVGTFNAPTVRTSKNVYLLFPSAFSVESIGCLPGARFYNLTLADLGALMRGVPEAPDTGKIAMDVAKDEVRTVLVGEEVQQVLKSYSVVGKVLAADLLDSEKLQNHFLLSCAGLGNQLARTYDLGTDADGRRVELTPERIADFFFDILSGKVAIADLDGTFNLSSIVSRMGMDAAPTSEAKPQETQTPETQAPKPPEAGETPGIFCSECGTANTPGSAFCENCGHKLE